MADSQRSLQVAKAHMQAAHAYAALSHAERLKVGAVIVRDGRIISIGYNGTPAGRDNACEIEDFNSDHYFDGKKIPLLITKPEVCHAEMNAILYAAKHGTPTDGCDLYVTHSPCFECAKMIVQCGIVKVFYETEYRDNSSIKFLEECGIYIKNINGE